MNTFFKKSIISALTVSVVAGAFSTAALAEDSADVQAGTTINKGTLTLSAIDSLNFETFELGDMQDLTDSQLIGGVDGFKVTDSTGTAAGWNLNVTADPLTDESDATNVLEGSLSITAPTTVTGGINSTDGELITKSGAGDVEDPAGVNLLNAGVDQGRGEFTAEGSELALDVAYLDASPGTYSSTVTFNLTTGP